MWHQSRRKHEREFLETKTLTTRTLIYRSLVVPTVENLNNSLLRFGLNRTKMINYVVFQLHTWKINHGDFKDSDFDDFRQPEIAIWPSKPEVLISESMTNIVKIPMNSLGLRSQQDRRKCSQIIASKLNRK